MFLKKTSDPAHEKLSTPQIDIEKARTSVKRKAVEDMHAHVDKMVCEKISASSLSYKHVYALKSAVYRERCKLLPTIPKSIEDVFSAAESQAFGLESFDVIIRDEPNKILIITSEDNLLHLSACENILGDGTFKSCPKFFEQLYTLHGYKDGIYSPCVFALLPDKKKPTYIRMLKLLQSACNERNFTLRLATVHTDLEVTMISAVHYIWPEAVVALCNFHLCQAWYRKIQAFNLTRDYRDVKSLVGRWLRLVFALPTLSADSVRECFLTTLTDLMPDTTEANLFADYIYGTYLHQDCSYPSDHVSRHPVPKRQNHKCL